MTAQKTAFGCRWRGLAFSTVPGVASAGSESARARAPGPLVRDGEGDSLGEVSSKVVQSACPELTLRRGDLRRGAFRHGPCPELALGHGALRGGASGHRSRRLVLARR